MRTAGLATVIVACLLLGPAGALGAGATVTSDSLPEVPAGGLAGLRVAVLTGGDGGSSVARAVSERLSADGAELVSDPTDLDALILAGATGEAVGLPAGLDADALVIDLQGGPELAGVVALGMDRATADRLAGTLAARIALDRATGAVGIIGFSPETDPPRMILVDDAIRAVPGGPALSIHSHLSDPAWGLDLGPMVTFGFAPVVLTLDDRATQAIVALHQEAGSDPAEVAIVGVGCDDITRALLDAGSDGLLEACIDASPDDRADAVARILHASRSGAVLAAVTVVPTAITEP